jgi:hypothetical protein
MQQQLNKNLGMTEKDRLIYDSSHVLDGRNELVTLDVTGAGVLKRGQVLDLKEDNFCVHAQDGEVSLIVAEDTPYEESDTVIPVQVYTSGCFRKEVLVTDVELTPKDVETFRSKGIWLK